MKIAFGVNLLAWITLGNAAITGQELRESSIGKGSHCADDVEAKAIIDPDIDSEFYTSTKSSHHWWIVRHPDGTFEDTTDGVIDKGDLIKIEHTAECNSTHQGDHSMKYCDAETDGETLTIEIWGGLPAYASSLKIKVDQKTMKYRCDFEAIYPNQTGPLKWRITRKELRLRNGGFETGSRLFGWISVEFEEESESGGRVNRHPYKIEGYLKPKLKQKRTAPQDK